jgi:hypothetical protein
MLVCFHCMHACILPCCRQECLWIVTACCCCRQVTRGGEGHAQVGARQAAPPPPHKQAPHQQVNVTAAAAAGAALKGRLLQTMSQQAQQEVQRHIAAAIASDCSVPVTSLQLDGGCHACEVHLTLIAHATPAGTWVLAAATARTSGRRASCTTARSLTSATTGQRRRQRACMTRCPSACMARGRRPTSPLTR